MPLLRSFRGLPKNKPLIKFLSEDGVRVLLQKTENFYMQDQSKEMHKVDTELFFVIDEKNNSIELTEKGIDLITGAGEDSKFFILPENQIGFPYHGGWNSSKYSPLIYVFKQFTIA